MRKDRLNMYKESYNHELARREKLGSELTIPIALVTLLFGSITYAIGKLEEATNGLLLFILILALIILVVAMVFAVVYSIKSYYNYIYEYIASSKQMEDYYNSLDEFYKIDNDKDIKVEDAFEVYLIKDYCKCNERNTLNNDKRSFYLHKVRTTIIVALITSAVILGTSNYNKIIETTQNCIDKVTTGKKVYKNGRDIKSTGTSPPASTANSAASITSAH